MLHGGGQWVGNRIINPKKESFLFDDFTGANSSGFADTGWASSNISTSLQAGDQTHVGVLSIHTSSSASGLGRLSRTATTHRFGGGYWIVQGLVNFDNLSTASEEYAFRWGFYDTTSTGVDAVDGVYFEYDRAANGDVWVLKTSNNSVRTATVTSTAVTTGAWIELRIEVNAAGTSAAYYVDGVLIGTVTTNIPTGSSRLTAEGMSILKSVGTTQRAVHTDYWWRYVAFSTPR